MDEYLKAEGIEYSDDPSLSTPNDEGAFVEFIRRGWFEYEKVLRGGKGVCATLDDAIEVQRVVAAVEKSTTQSGVSIELNLQPFRSSLVTYVP